MGRNRFFIPSFACAALVVLTGCGGGGLATSPPQNFSVSVSPSTLSMTAGTISPPTMITVAGQNGFTGQVSIEISGLPLGATSSPATPFTVSASGSLRVVLFIPPAAQTGSLSIQFVAGSGSHSHSAPLTLTVMPVSGTVGLQEVPGQVVAGTIEIQGLSAGIFNSDYWQKNTLNWVPDVRMPMLAPQTTGPPTRTFMLLGPSNKQTVGVCFTEVGTGRMFPSIRSIVSPPLISSALLIATTSSKTALSST